MRILIEDPFTKRQFTIERNLPLILFFGTDEDCCIMLIPSTDPKTWGKYRGPFHDYLKAELFGEGRPVVHITERGEETVN